MSSIYLLCFFVCQSVVNKCQNGWTAELIGIKFCVGPHMNPGKVYGPSQLKYFSLKIQKLPTFSATVINLNC